MWSVVKLALILFHWNASAESDFLVNNDILFENQRENVLFALGLTYDATKCKGGWHQCCDNWIDEACKTIKTTLS